MKVIKPNELGVFYRFFKFRENYGVFSFYLMYDLINKKVLEYNTLYEKILSFYNKPLDEGYPKIKAEYLVCGSAYAYDNDTKAIKAGVRVGEKEKELAVFGKREWKLSFPSEPEKFISQKIRYYDVSPPLVEYPDKLVTSKSDKYTPASFDVIPFKMRNIKGNFRDYEKFWPYFPDDFDLEFFNIAAPDQRFEQYFDEEEIEIKNMHPKYPLIKTKIPSVNVRFFIKKDNFYEVSLRKDTLWLFPDILAGMVIFRGVVKVEDEKFSDIEYVYCEIEHEKQDAKVYYENFLKKIKPIEPVSEPGIKEIKSENIKLAKKIKTIIKQSIGELPSIKYDPIEMQKANDFAKVLDEVQIMKKKMQNHLNSVSEYVKLKNFEDFIVEEHLDWSDKAYDFINRCAKDLINKKEFPNDFIELSLIGYNDTEFTAAWGDKEVNLPVGYVFARFDKDKIRAVRIKNENGIFTVNGSDEKFPLKIIENEKYPYFWCDNDLEGWLVNYECYDICNVIVCPKEDIEKHIGDSKLVLFNDDLELENKTVIKSEKSVFELFKSGKLREIFLSYLDADESYEEDLGFDEAEKIVKNKISSKLEELEKISLSLDKEFENLVKQAGFNSEGDYETEEVDEKEMFEEVISILKQTNTFSREELNQLISKKDVLYELADMKKERLSKLEEKLKKAEEEFKNIKLPPKLQSEKYKFKEFVSANNAIFEIDEDNKKIENIDISDSLIKGKVKKAVFINCKFNNVICELEFDECEFEGCEIKNTVFKKNINARFKGKFVSNIFEKIEFSGEIENLEQSMFVGCKINNFTFNDFSLNSFIDSTLENGKVQNTFFKNSFNKSGLKNIYFDVNSKNLTFISSNVLECNFKGKLQHSRFMKKSVLENCDFSKTMFENATFFESDIKKSKFVKSQMNNSLINKSLVEECDFRKAKMKKNRLEYSRFNNTLFGGCDFYLSSFKGSVFENTSLIWTNLYGVEMFNAVFVNTLFDNANFQKTYIKKEQIKNG